MAHPSREAGCKAGGRCGVLLAMMLTTILLISTANASIFSGRRCTHPSGVRYESVVNHGGAMPSQGAVISTERWWYGEVLLGEQVQRYLEDAPPPVLAAEWGPPGTAAAIPSGFGEVASRQGVALARADGQPLHPELGVSLAITMACTDVYTPPRPAALPR